jgi:hypothetical protein
VSEVFVPSQEEEEEEKKNQKKSSKKKSNPHPSQFDPIPTSPV